MNIDRILILGAVLALVMFLDLGLQAQRTRLTCMDQHDDGVSLCLRMVRGQ